MSQSPRLPKAKMKQIGLKTVWEIHVKKMNKIGSSEEETKRSVQQWLPSDDQTRVNLIKWGDLD